MILERVPGKSFVCMKCRLIELVEEKIRGDILDQGKPDSEEGLGLPELLTADYPEELEEPGSDLSPSEPDAEETHRERVTVKNKQVKKCKQYSHRFQSSSRVSLYRQKEKEDLWHLRETNKFILSFLWSLDYRPKSRNITIKNFKADSNEKLVNWN
ncbi:hypothetical protein UY3_11090 [Chelonia mydas]|uniref:Uncharacterized protein n=1 Tax=Chelonia mydas TaxID=8469 RepID=M7B3X3_CHEMY|nr:hypothetical protein UY3_11090 [Chelonia mydas]